jgi:hypothetical protein
MTTNVTEQKKFDLATTEGKLELAKGLLELPQVYNSIIHRFGPGVYIREAHYPKGIIIAGQEHVGEHINMLLKGKINVISDAGHVVCLEAPHMFVAKAGNKVGYTLEETVWQNIYATTETDIETLEATLFKAPEFFDDHLKAKLAKDYAEHEEDRNDFDLMLQQTGWTKEDVLKASNVTEDRIPFPYGNYKLASGNSPIQGKGMFSTAVIQKDEVIAPMRLDGKRTPAGYLINHSKTPNTVAIINPDNNMYLVASRDIHGMVGGQLGEELTLDYRQVMKINNLWDGEIKCQPEYH